MAEIAIIGAGMAGLTLAQKLSAQHNVSVFEKARGVGGRMSHHYSGDFDFDHGAQYFVARDARFIEFLQGPIYSGIVRPWTARFADIGEQGIIWQKHWQHSHWVATPAMNALAKHMAKGFSVYTRRCIKSCERKSGHWFVQDEQGDRCGPYDYLLFAIPVTQCLALLPEECSFYQHIAHYTMQPCFTLMLGLSVDFPRLWDVAHIRDPILSWVSINSTKPGRDSAISCVVNATNAWAAQHLDDEPDAVVSMMLERLKQCLSLESLSIDYHKLHRWRYANSPAVKGPPCFFDAGLRLGACGDWCIRGRVEAAFHSGYQLAETVTGY